jgi:predicted NAD-dependent protein-ADP-ribosyltransferase YbiA (DUF1768 family)
MITTFKGKYAFLDPAAYCVVEFDHMLFNSAEAAFLAAQYDDHYFRSLFRNSVLPIWRARELAKRLQKRRDWTPELSLELMQAITFDKFSRDERLRAKLIATAPERIIAENTWHENFWGRCVCNTRPGKYGRKDACLVLGSNHYGKIVTAVRAQLAAEVRAVAA